MSASENVLDIIAETFSAMNMNPSPIEKVLQAAGITDFHIPVNAMKNAMAMRGITYASGILSRTAGPIDMPPSKPDHDEFVRRVTEVVGMSEEPIPAGVLIGMLGLVNESIPSRMSAALRGSGVHFIPGAGFWTHSHYISPDGSIIHKKFSSARHTAMLAAFQAVGWPMTLGEMEEATGGAVSRRYASSSAFKKGDRLISVVDGLVFPAVLMDRRNKRWIPMSHNTIRDVMKQDPDKIILLSEAPRLYKIGRLMGKEGFAKIRNSWTTRDGKSERGLYLTITSATLEYMRWHEATEKKDEF